MATSAAKEYTSGQIQVLKGLEAVRKRPGMYIGSTGPRGLHHLVYEVVDNSIDEALAGHADSVDVTIHEDDSVTVVDNGRGFPVDMHPDGRDAGCGARAHRAARRRQVRQGHLQGLGRSARRRHLGGERALRVAEHHRQARRQGPRDRLRPRRQDPGARGGREPRKDTGTSLTFKPDHEIFPELVYSFDTLSTRLRELAFLNKGVRLTLTDERKPDEETGPPRARSTGTRAESGPSSSTSAAIASRCTRSRSTSRPSARRPRSRSPCSTTTGYTDNTFTFVNNINTHEGGTHLTGFKSALTRTINDYAKRTGPLQEGRRGGALGRRRARGAHLRDLRQGQGAAVRGADQDEARQQRGQGRGGEPGEREALRVPRGEPGRRARHHREVALGGPRAGGGPQGARPHAQEERAGDRRPSRASSPTAR
jgi:DNA gyrase subunit B